MIISIFLFLQCILFVFMFLHDWVDIFPLNDIKALRNNHSYKILIIQTIINVLVILYPLLLTYIYADYGYPYWVTIAFVCCYGFLTLGTIMTWWVPYLFGSSIQYKAGFVEYKNTHHCLPARGDNVIPNTLHVVLHILVWACFAISLYIFFR